MTIELSKTQQTILEQAAAAPENCIRTFMSHIPAAAQTKVIDTLVKKGCVKRKAQFHPSEPNGKEVLYLITDEGMAAVGKAPIEPKEEKPKRVSKQSTMLDMLREGTTINAIMQATSWQKHTVHGSMANLKKKLGLTITSDKAEGGERVYRIA
jgi:DNA-binding NarL/FixJ family response regulator